MTDPDITLPAADAWRSPAPRANDPFGPGAHPFVPPPPDWYEAPVFAVFSNVVARQPAAPALCAGPRHLSYAAAHDRVVGLARRIIGVTAPGDGVALLLADQMDLVIAQMACFAAGRVCILVDPALPAARQGAILDRAVPRLLITSEGLPALAMTARMTVWYVDAGADWASGADGAGGPALPPIDLEAPAVVIFTSGSTGEPKGIVRTHRQVTARNLRFVEELRIGPDDRVLVLFSLTNSSGFAGGIAALLAGAAMHLATDGTAGLRGALQTLRLNRVTVLWAVPSTLRAMLALHGAAEAVATVRATFSVGEPILRSDVENWRRVVAPDCAMLGAYGLTEAGGVATWFLPRDAASLEARVPIGYPCGLYEFAIVTEDGKPVDAGEAGELWLRGRAITPGEWRAGRCLPMSAVTDPTDPRRRILRTRDMVRLRPDGSLAYVGRADDMVKIRGNRVEPAEVEDALRRLPAIADVAVLAQRDGDEARLLAFVVLAPGATTDRAALIRHLRGVLPAYMIPAQVEFLPVIPRLPLGKVDTRRLGAPPTSRPMPELS